MIKRIVLLLKSYKPYAASSLLLLVALAALSVVNVNAQCKQWDVGGNWVMDQTNGFSIKMDIRQNGAEISGKAFYQYLTNDGFLQGKSVHDVTGIVLGDVVGNEYSASIKWSNGGLGIYNGQVSAGGKLQGSAYAKEKPQNTANWSTTQKMTCKESAQKVPLGSILIKTGKPRTTTPAKEKQPTSPPMKVPGIVMSQAVFPLGQPQGFVNLTWDGGADHPYAEVWVKVDDADEKQLIEKGKGTMNAQVEHGKRYLFILTDSGVTLSTVGMLVR